MSNPGSDRGSTPAPSLAPHTARREIVSTPPPLPGLFRTLAPILENYGYLAVGGLVMLEDFGVPVPGESTLIAAAIYAGAGRLNVVVVGLVGFVAAVFGDNIGFAIGKYGGRELVLRWGRFVFLTAPRLARAEAFFARHGGQVVVVARFIEGLRQANGILAGMSEMPWPRFVVYNILGAAPWVGLWTGLGYAAGNNIDTVYPEVVRYELYIVIGLGVGIAVYLGRRLWRWRRGKVLSESPAETRDR